MLFCPFIPFIVLFCYSIEQGSLDDLQLIEQFGNSLEPCRRFSHRVENLFQLCQALNNLVRVFVQARVSTTIHTGSGNEFLPDCTLIVGQSNQDSCTTSTGHQPTLAGTAQSPITNQQPQLMSPGLDQDDLHIFDIMNMMDTGDLANSYNTL